MESFISAKEAAKICKENSTPEKKYGKYLARQSLAPPWWG
jgi:hypothetical protein